MKITGDASLPVERARVFAALQDPEFLVHCIPGCEELERTGEGVYRATVRAGVGAVKGRFQATVTLSDLDPPEGYTMALDCKSPVGHAGGSARITLSEEPGEGEVPERVLTRVAWEGEARVSGLLASVGQRLVGAGANKLARQFFAAAAQRLSEKDA